MKWLKQNVSKAALAIGACLALFAGVFGAFGSDSAAWIFLGTAVAVLSGAASLSFRKAFKLLRQATAHQELSKVEQRATALSRKLTAVQMQVKHLPYVNTELIRRQEDLIHDDLPMPTVGANWAVSAPTLLFMVDEVLGNGRRRVLECGSGASTVWTAAAIRHRGEGHVFSLENDKHFAEQTRHHLRAHGLEQWATVIDAPLVEMDVPGVGRGLWYDLEGLGDTQEIDLLFVDGPPGSTGPLARYPALPQLRPRLANGATVVLDDTHRTEERKIVKMWSHQGAFATHVSVAKVVGQSTVLLVA